MHELRLFLTALQFFTRVPVPAWVGWSPAQLNASARHFPTVGWLVGAVCGVVLAGAGWLWPPLVAALLALAAGVWLTGGFHEDGLADSCDGFGGGQDRAQVLAIMKDSRIGSYGAIALVLALGLKAVLWAELLRQQPALSWAGFAALMAAALSVHALSRWAALLVMARLSYVREDALSKSKPIAQGVPLSALAVATVLAVLPGLLLGAGWRLGLAVLVAAAVGGLAIRFCRRRLGGYVGDALGATQQLAELAVLLAWVAHV